MASGTGSYRKKSSGSFTRISTPRKNKSVGKATTLQRVTADEFKSNGNPTPNRALSKKSSGGMTVIKKGTPFKKKATSNAGSRKVSTRKLTY